MMKELFKHPEDLRPGMENNFSIYDSADTTFRCLNPECKAKTEIAELSPGPIVCPECSKSHTLSLVKSCDIGTCYSHFLFAKLS